MNQPPTCIPNCANLPVDCPAGNYYLNPVSPSQASTDRVDLNWTASPNLIFNGNVSYSRLRDTYTNYPQNVFGADNMLTWRPINRLRLIADYHQQNLVNSFTPYYNLYGNLSYHRHDAGAHADYELPKGFNVEAYYQRAGISRANAFLWPQVYSADNTDLVTVVPSSTSNTTGLALRYHDRNSWSARAGYEWTGTNNPGFLIVPQSNNRAFADVWLTPTKWLVLGNDFNAIVQNAFPAIPLPNTPTEAPGFGGSISGLPPDFQRRNRYCFEIAQCQVEAAARVESRCRIFLPAKQSHHLYGLPKRQLRRLCCRRARRPHQTNHPGLLGGIELFFPETLRSESAHHL